MNLPITIKGENGQIELFDNRIEISRKGFKAFMCHGFDGTKIIFIRKMTALQFKEAGKATNGFIQFIFEGSLEDKGGLFGATKDENTIIFNQNQQADFEKVRDYICSRMDF